MAPGLCCCFAVAAVGGENDLSKAYLIHSWEDSEEPLIHSQKELVEKPKKKPENDTFSDEEEEDEEVLFEAGLKLVLSTEHGLFCLNACSLDL